MERSLTQGKPYRQIISFTIPLLLGNLFQQFYSMVDAFIVSRTLGVEALAGVSSTDGIFQLIIGFAQGLTIGLSIAISQSLGAKDYEKLKKQYVHNLIISVTTAVLLTVIGLACTKPALEALQTPEEIIPFAADYLHMLFAGIIATILFNLFSNTMRALGDSKTPLVYLVVSCALNIVLDYILILWTPLGVAGAALATILAQGLSAILCLVTIIKRFKILSLKSYKGGFSFDVLLSNSKLGFPMAFQLSIIAIGYIAIQFSINRMGTIAVASAAVGKKIDDIAVEPLRSFGMTMTTYSAQNYGAKLYKRISDGAKQCILICSGMAIILGLVMFFFGRELTALFVGYAETEILNLSHRFLTIHGSLYLVLVFLFTYRYTLQGIGKTGIPTFAGIMELVLRLVSAIYVIPTFAFIGVSLSAPISWMAGLIPCAIAYLFAMRQLKKNLDTQLMREG